MHPVQHLGLWDSHHYFELNIRERECEKENVKAPSAPEALNSTQWPQCLCLSLVNTPCHSQLPLQRGTHTLWFYSLTVLTFLCASSQCLCYRSVLQPDRHSDMTCFIRKWLIYFLSFLCFYYYLRLNGINNKSIILWLLHSWSCFLES